MAKSWKKLVNSTDSNTAGGSSLNDIQLTLDEIASQSPELNNLLQERQSLENEMGQLIQSGNPVVEDPRFAGSVESFREKREKEKNRAAQKKKLEERISRKNKELEKWEQNQQRLKQKLALQKKLLQKKETDQDPSTSQKAPKSKEKNSEKRWFETNRLQKQKDVIEKKKEVLTERIRKTEKVPGQLKEQKKSLDYFGQKDLEKFRQKPDPGKKSKAIPVQIPKIKDNWEEKRESVKEKIALRKLSDKLDEAKRFAQIPEQSKKQFSEIREMAKDLEKTVSLDDRQIKASENASAKKTEQKEEERREKQKEGLLSRKRAERKEEERSSKKKERKNDKYI